MTEPNQSFQYEQHDSYFLIKAISGTILGSSYDEPSEAGEKIASLPLQEGIIALKTVDTEERVLILEIYWNEDKKVWAVREWNIPDKAALIDNQLVVEVLSYTASTSDPLIPWSVLLKFLFNKLSLEKLIYFLAPLIVDERVVRKYVYELREQIEILLSYLLSLSEHVELVKAQCSFLEGCSISLMELYLRS